MPKKELEQTLVLIKPDALKNSLTGYVLSQLSEFHSGLRFAGIKVNYPIRACSNTIPATDTFIRVMHCYITITLVHS